MQKTFRLFVSSTFSDFNEERILLQTKVFPEIKKFCLENKLNFQPIDLRWGVSAEAQLDQKTLKLCLDEVRSSKIHPHPNFLIMAGDRYGWIPLPYMIGEEEFDYIVKYFEKKGGLYYFNGIQSFHAIKKIKEWYKLDLNQIYKVSEDKYSSAYVLNERKGKYENCLTWEEEEKILSSILQEAAKNIFPKLSDYKKLYKYFRSATEAEVVEGIFKYLDETDSQKEQKEQNSSIVKLDYEHVYAYIRNIDSIDNLESKFKDEKTDDVKRFKKTLKESIKKENLYEVNVNLKEVDQDEKNYSLNYKYQELDSFEDKILNYLKNSINAYLENIEDITPQELEAYEQNRFKNDKLKDFLPGSRDEALKTIDNYINSNETQALVVYGKSGLGKSSLMAKAIEDTQSKYTTKKTIYRFAGSTANLSTSVEILISILNELGIKEEIRKVQNPQTLQEENEKIEEFYYRIHDHFKSLEKEIVIFLDAIDQVNNEDNFLWLPQNLPSNVKFIISALDDENYKIDSSYFESLKTKSNNLYQLQKFEELQSKELVNSMLKKYNRTIQSNQMEYLLKQKDSNSPLYLSVALQELRHWKSTDKTIEEDENGQDLASTQKEIIQEFISNLSQFYHHDKEFVKRVFSYLYLTQGLSESELLEVLNTDEEFIKEIAPDTYHNNLTKELPIVIWSRLHTQLKEFLKLEQKDNQETMSFFHREFNEVIKEQEDIKQTHEHLIELLQKLILEYQDTKFDSNRWGKLYIEVVKDYHLEYEFDWLIDENSKLKEYGVFLSKVRNGFYQEYIFYRILKLGSEFGDINKSNLENSYKKFAFYECKELYKENPNKWAENYTLSLSSLAISFYSIEKINESIELEEESLEITKKLYKKNPSRWAEDYTTSLSNLASSLKSKGKIDEAIELEKESLEIRKELYEKNPSRWAENYTTSLSNFALSLQFIGKKSEVIKLQHESLEITKELYKENPSRWAEDYSLSLNNLATSLKSMEKIAEAIELEKESLEIRKELYEENPSRWAENYTISLNNLATSLKDIDREFESIILEKEALKIIEELFLNNKARWSRKYLYYLNNIGKTALKLNDYSNSLNYYEKYFEIFNIKEFIISYLDFKFLIYPFILYYQVSKLNSIDVNNLNEYIESKIKELKEIYRDEYCKEIDKIHEIYSTIKDSQNKMDRERYELFIKIFIDEDFS